jgi:hypothetical protein
MSIGSLVMLVRSNSAGIVADTHGSRNRSTSSGRHARHLKLPSEMIPSIFPMRFALVLAAADLP